MLFRRAVRLLPFAFPRGDVGIIAGERKGYAPRTSRFLAAAADLFSYAVAPISRFEYGL
jgi:hypothetical protein